jgi:hypothetical protein
MIIDADEEFLTFTPVNKKEAFRLGLAAWKMPEYVITADPDCFSVKLKVNKIFEALYKN